MTVLYVCAYRFAYMRLCSVNNNHMCVPWVYLLSPKKHALHFLLLMYIVCVWVRLTQTVVNVEWPSYHHQSRPAIILLAPD